MVQNHAIEIFAKNMIFGVMDLFIEIAICYFSRIFFSQAKNVIKQIFDGRIKKLTFAFCFTHKFYGKRLNDSESTNKLTETAKSVIINITGSQIGT